jgi:hypothetical protein
LEEGQKEKKIIFSFVHAIIKELANADHSIAVQLSFRFSVFTVSFHHNRHFVPS